MKTVLLNDSFPPVIDGVSNTILNYADYLQKHGDTPLVAVPRYPDVVDDYPFEVLRYPSMYAGKKVGYRAGRPFTRKAMNRLSQFSPELIHTHCPVASTLLARELREIVHVPIILTYHTKFDYDLARFVRSKALQHIMVQEIIRNVSACDDIWVVNEGAGKNLKELGFEGEYTVMPNGVDIDPSPCAPEILDKLNDEYALKAEEPLFLFVGRMLWYKGQRYILEGLARLKAKEIPFRMAFVGDGGDLENIRKEAENLGILDRCIFTGSILDRERLKAWYSRADAFLLPSVFDNNPLVVKEAASCSTPSVLVRDSSSADGVTHMENGFLISESSEEMGVQLEWICRNLPKTKEIGEKASQTLYVSWDDSIARARKRYEEILTLHRTGELPPHRTPIDNGIIRMVSGFYKAFAKKPAPQE